MTHTCSPPVVTPTVDKVFAVVMTYAAVVGWLSRRYTVHTGTRQKVILMVILVYITASLPIHYSTYVTNSTQLVTIFPLRYGALFMVVVGAMLVFVWRLRIQRPNTLAFRRSRALHDGNDPSIARPSQRPISTP